MFESVHRQRAVVTAVLMTFGVAAGGSTARAEVTINEKTVFDGFGEGGWMGTEGTEVIVVSGDRMRQEATTKPTGKMLKKFAGEEGFRNATIMRLDRKLMYMVDYHDKSYQEIPLDAFKEMQGELAKAMAGPEAPQQERPQAQEPPPIKCNPVTVEAKRTGERQDIAGFAAQRAVVTGTQTCQNVETKQTCEMIYTMDYWNAPMTPALQEIYNFYRRQMEAMGMDMKDAQALGNAARAMMSQNTEGFESVLKELGKIEGYPVRTRMLIEKGGDCGLGGPGEGGQPGMGEAMKGMGDAFKGIFGKKKSGSGESAAKPEASAPGRKKLFGMSSEITSVTTSAAGADAFEPPAGFKKKEAPKMERPKS